MVVCRAIGPSFHRLPHLLSRVGRSTIPLAQLLPAALPNGKLNRLGLVNFLGIVAFVFLILLMLPAYPPLRTRLYHTFQLLHLPAAALFVVCCALHDLPILLFAVPGIASWYMEWRGRGGKRCSSRRLSQANVQLLPGTSWVELRVDCGAETLIGQPPRGQWISLRVVALGREFHPLSVASVPSPAAGTDTRAPARRELSVIVSAKAGDWTQALAAHTQLANLEVEVAGPYPFGGGDWSLIEEEYHRSSRGAPALLLIAGGTGITGWLPALTSSGSNAGRPCHLVWCVQNEADYHALAGMLPMKQQIEVTVYVTRASTAAAISGSLASPLITNGESETRQPQDDVCSSSSLASVSLVTAIVGLVVGYWGWSYLVKVLGLSKFTTTESGWLHTTLTGYTITRRCFPIVLILAVMALTTAVCSKLFAYVGLRCAARSRTRCSEHPSDTELGNVVSPRLVKASLFTGASSSSAAAATEGPRQAGTEVVTVDLGGHNVRSGRPDLEALVRAAVGNETQRLVVAAVGPASLVAATRKAVASVRKERRGVRIEFSGADARW